MKGQKIEYNRIKLFFYYSSRGVYLVNTFPSTPFESIVTTGVRISLTEYSVKVKPRQTKNVQPKHGG